MELQATARRVDRLRDSVFRHAGVPIMGSVHHVALARCVTFSPVLPEDVSHADIYRALGVLEGKLDALGQTLTQRNMDFTTALNRITELEKTVAKGLGIALACSLIVPLLVGMVVPRIHLNGEPPRYAPPASKELR
jgi:hypothetical protein